MTYNPCDWYWLADDGRVFASARGVTVDKTDASFAAFEAAGGAPTAWPRDATGAQTAAALDAVLLPYGLSTSGPVREATSYDLVADLTDGQVAALATAKVKDQHLFGKRSDPWPENNPKIARLAGAIGITPAAWFDLALKPPAA